jgi:murein DD-endopeptidase MepM/ murein hydrolase activator NlpD
LVITYGHASKQLQLAAQPNHNESLEFLRRSSLRQATAQNVEPFSAYRSQSGRTLSQIGTCVSPRRREFSSFLGWLSITTLAALAGLASTPKANALVVSSPLELSASGNGSLQAASPLAAQPDLDPAVVISTPDPAAVVSLPPPIINVPAPVLASAAVTDTHAATLVSGELSGFVSTNPVGASSFSTLPRAVSAVPLGESISLSSASPLGQDSDLSTTHVPLLAPLKVESQFSQVSLLVMQPQQPSPTPVVSEVAEGAIAPLDNNDEYTHNTKLVASSAQGAPVYPGQVGAPVSNVGGATPQSSGVSLPTMGVPGLQVQAVIARAGVVPDLPELELPPLPSVDRYLPAPNAPGLTTKLIWPSRGTFTSGYGPRWGRMHRGIDIAGPVGTPIVAAASGVVVDAGWNEGGFGNLVKIQHPDGSLTLYAHNSRVIARVGQQVQQGEEISEMGSTGRSTGPHLHFEFHPPGMGAVNPLTYLNRG